MKTATQLMAELNAAFISFPRANGEAFVKLKAGAPKWMTDVCRDAHRDMMPDDTRYRMIRDVVAMLDERPADEWDDSDVMHEICDGLVDVYTARLTSWLSSHLDRLGYCDQAASEGLLADDADMSSRMSTGQYLEYQEIYSSIVASIQELAETDDETDGDA